MFRWRRPKCPIEPDFKLWVERRMAWLTDRLGWDHLLERPIVLPDDQVFQESYESSEEGVSAVFRRLCDHAGVPDREIVSLLEPKGNEVEVRSLYGFYGLRMDEDARTRTSLGAWHCEDSGRVAAGLAHRISRHLLCREGLCDGCEPDFDPVAELLSVALGFGVLAANAVLRDHGFHIGALEGWSISKLGTLDHRAYGYALGLVTWIRGERSGPWANALRRDVRTPFRQAEAYLRATADSTFARAMPLEAGWLVPYPGDVTTLKDVEHATAEAAEHENAEKEITIARLSSGEAFSCGILAMNEGDYYDAIRYLSAVISKEAEDAEAYLNRGEAYLALERYRKALDDARASLELDAEEMDGIYLRGRAFFHLGLLADAATDFTRLVKEEGRGTEAIHRKWRGHYWLGRVHVAQGNTEQALKAFSSAVNFGPLEVEPYVHRSRVYERMRKMAEAQADREEAFRLDPARAEAEFGSDSA